MPKNASQRQRQVKDTANNYTETVHTLLAFSALLCHDGKKHRHGSAFGFGRRMATSATNTVSPNQEVTPDCVAQTGEKYGIAAEVKKSLPQEQDHWADTAKQLRKYDDDLTGWWTGNQKITQSDAVLLIHISRGRAFRSYLEQQQKDVPAAVGRASAIVEFSRNEEARSYVFFRREWGTIRDTEIAEALENGTQVPIEKVLGTFPSIRYYDAKPPLELLLKEIWLDLYSRQQRAPLDPESGSYEVVVDIGTVTDELQRAYGSKNQNLRQDDRSATFPQLDWVREAFEALVEFKLAERDSKPNVYRVRYRQFRGELLERFAAFIDKQPLTKPDAAQILLFPLNSQVGSKVPETPATAKPKRKPRRS